mmetsp:Transcript_6973/g.29526  ORF Transcript_6973/g.29526 Transcript_6973/m.29526 type:complete len:380 (-) Transcript_6973:1175-2314(-)
MRCIDLRIRHLQPVVEQGLDDLARARRREAPVGREAGDEELGRGRREGARQVAAMLGGRVEVVECAGDQQIGVGVEVVAELVALVAQIAFDLELDLLRGVAELAGLELAAELLGHHIVAQIGDVADHPRHAQAALGDHAVGVEMAAVEVGVGDDGAPRHLVEGDVLRRQIGGGRDGDAMRQALGVAQRPVQGLHAAQAAAQHRRQLLNAEARDDSGLGIDPILHRDDREVRAPGPAGGRVEVHRAGRAEARAQIVDADDEELVGVQRLARADQVVPPAFAPRLARIGAGHVMAGVERMTHQHRVAALGIEPPIGLDHQVVRAKACTAAQPQRLVEMKTLRRHLADASARHGLTPGQVLRAVHARRVNKKQNRRHLRDAG